MANIRFLRGKHADLFKTGASYADGTFYLTTDSNRLYVGKTNENDASKVELCEINRYIHVAETYENLTNPPFAPKEGDFAFIKQGNILAVYMTKEVDGVINTGWTQVNADHNNNDNTDTLVTGVSGSVDIVASTKLDIEVVIAQVEKDLINDTSKNLSNVTGTITITKQNLIDVLSLTVNTAVTKTETDNYVLTTIKSGESEVGKVKVVAGKNVSIESVEDGYEINVLADQIKTDYDLVNDGTKVKLMLDGSENAGEVEFKNGTDLEVSGESGSITYSHKIYDTASTSVTNDKTLKDNGTGKLNIISGITLSNGHITTIDVDELTIPEDTDTNVTAVRADSAGKIHITRSDDVIIDSDADLYYTLGDNEEKYYNQGALPVYTKDEVDERIADELADINAMVFRGAVPSAGLPTSSVKIGDTYILNSSEITVSGMNVGDLAIARGTEDQTGYITGAIDWVIVPSADEVVITYWVERDGNTLKLLGSDDSVETVKFLAETDSKIANNNDIIVTGKTENGAEIFTFAHKDYSNSIEGLQDQDKLTHNGTFDIVKNITLSNGHVTGIVTDTLTLPNDNDTQYSLLGTNNTVKLKADGSEDAGSISIVDSANNPIDVSATHSNNDSTFTITHKTATIDTAKVADTVLTHGSTLTVYDVDADSYGHVIARKAHTYTMPTESTYDLALVDNDNNTLTNTGYTVKLMKDGSEFVDSYTVSSSTLEIVAGTDNKATIDIQWGSF